MRTQQDYLDLARERLHLRSDNALRKVVNIPTSTMSKIRTGQTVPTEKQICDLARAAGIDEQVALIERSFWAAPDEATRMVYKSLMEKITGVASVLIFAAVLSYSSGAHASTFGEHHTNINNLNYRKYTLSHKHIIQYDIPHNMPRLMPSARKRPLHATFREFLQDRYARSAQDVLYTARGCANALDHRHDTRDRDGNRSRTHPKKQCPEIYAARPCTRLWQACRLPDT